MNKISINKIAHLTGHKGGVFSLAQGKEDHLFLSGAGDGWIVEWDLTNPENGRLIAQAEDTQTSGRASVFSLLEKNDWIVAGNMNGGLHWIHPKEVAENKDILAQTYSLFKYGFANAFETTLALFLDIGHPLCYVTMTSPVSHL